jgi:DNA-binding response OmpR family regulator
VTERLLVVDDEEVNRELLDAILTEAGYEVLFACDGHGALEAAESHRPDLILLDLLMPGISGLEVCQRLKQSPATARIPVIVVTAVGQLATKEAVLTRGADDFVTKPFRPDDLRARVQAMLAVRPIGQELDRALAYLRELETARRGQVAGGPNGIPTGPRRDRSEGFARSLILLVDDDAMVRTFYGDLLTEHEFQVCATGSGREGLSVVASQPVEAVILDIVMPEMSGLEMLETLRGQDADLPVIMLTGHATSQNAITALKLGAFDFIVKGQDPSLILLTVHRAVRHRHNTLQQRAEVAQLQAQIAQLKAGTA